VPTEVACPHCGARAVVPDRPAQTALAFCWPRRFGCATCLSTATWSARTRSFCGGEQYFRLPLARTAQCCGLHTKWAFTEAHRTLLTGYAAATRRDGRLPAWLRPARNHDDALRALARLHDPELSTGRR
jgi:hypothetical protein